ncbi:MAG TPA: hypothetical protein VJ891_16635 [Casimicrobiaceae bacterium]|jgi:hypothetical protein|nr:hypothetical protein [Casimicrobiaceae bacterium]
MKKTLIGTTLALFAFAPAMAVADCGGMHEQAAAMASSKPADTAAQAQVASKAATPVVAKATTAKHVKQASKTATSPSKTDGSTVVAKNN